MNGTNNGNGHGGYRKGSGRKPGALSAFWQECLQEFSGDIRGALKLLRDVFTDETKPDKLRVEAACEFLDRAVGRPQQMVTINNVSDIPGPHSIPDLDPRFLLP